MESRWSTREEVEREEEEEWGVKWRKWSEREEKRE